MRATLEEGRSLVDAYIPEPKAAEDVSLSLLGGFELRVDRHVRLLTTPEQRLVVFLALHRRPLIRHFVSQRLWPDTDEAHGRGSLRVALCGVGKVAASLIDKASAYLALGPLVRVDLDHSAGLATRLQGDPSSVEESELDEGLLSEELLPGWSVEWIIPHQERYRQLRRHALESVCERLTAAGHFARAVQAGLAAVAAEPFGERANLLLVKAYLAEGNAGEAVRHYRLFEKLLRDELGVTPAQSFTLSVKPLIERPLDR